MTWRSWMLGRYINTAVTSLYPRSRGSTVGNFRSTTSGFRWREVESERVEKWSRLSQQDRLQYRRWILAGRVTARHQRCVDCERVSFTTKIHNNLYVFREGAYAWAPLI